MNEVRIYESWDDFLLSRNWGRVLTGRERNASPEEMTPQNFLHYFLYDTRKVVVPDVKGKGDWILLFHMRELHSGCEYTPEALIQDKYEGILIVFGGSPNEGNWYSTKAVKR